MLTRRATRLQNALNQVSEQITIWTLTRDAALATKDPGAILLKIDVTIATLQDAREMLESQTTSILDLQSQAAAATARCEDALALIADSQIEAAGRIFPCGHETSEV